MADGALFTDQIVYVIIAIASWYYPNPDVATSNGLQGLAAAADPRNVTIDTALLRDLLKMAKLDA